MSLDEHIQRLQNIEPFNVYSVSDAGDVAPWYEVDGAIVQSLVVYPQDLPTQVSAISAQIMHWGRLTSQCKRVWEIEERLFRVWKAQQFLRLTMPPKDADGWKKPTVAATEATYRTDPDYNRLYNAVERAEEAYNSAMAVLDGFRAKRDMLRAYAMRSRDDSAPQLAI